MAPERPDIIPIALGIMSDPPMLVLTYDEILALSSANDTRKRRRQRKMPIRYFTDRSDIHKVHFTLKHRHDPYLSGVASVTVLKMLRVVQEIMKGLKTEDAVIKVNSEFDIDPDEDLNKVSSAELAKKKEIMDEVYLQKLIKPGDPGFIYDKVERFDHGEKQRSEWDDNDGESCNIVIGGISFGEEDFCGIIETRQPEEVEDDVIQTQKLGEAITVQEVASRLSPVLEENVPLDEDNDVIPLDEKLLLSICDVAGEDDDIFKVEENLTKMIEIQETVSVPSFVLEEKAQVVQSDVPLEEKMLLSICDIESDYDKLFTVEDNFSKVTQIQEIPSALNPILLEEKVPNEDENDIPLDEKLLLSICDTESDEDEIFKTKDDNFGKIAEIQETCLPSHALLEEKAPPDLPLDEKHLLSICDVEIDNDEIFKIEDDFNKTTEIREATSTPILVQEKVEADVPLDEKQLLSICDVEIGDDDDDDNVLSIADFDISLPFGDGDNLNFNRTAHNKGLPQTSQIDKETPQPRKRVYMTRESDTFDDNAVLKKLFPDTIIDMGNSSFLSETSQEESSPQMTNPTSSKIKVDEVVDTMTITSKNEAKVDGGDEPTKDKAVETVISAEVQAGNTIKSGTTSLVPLSDLLEIEGPQILKDDDPFWEW